MEDAPKKTSAAIATPALRIATADQRASVVIPVGPSSQHENGGPRLPHPGMERQASLRDRFRVVVQTVVAANRFATPKGLPVVNPDTVRSVIHHSAPLSSHRKSGTPQQTRRSTSASRKSGAVSGSTPNANQTPGSGSDDVGGRADDGVCGQEQFGRGGERRPADTAAHLLDITEDEALDCAAVFLRDAIEKRNPNMRLASLIGLQKGRDNARGTRDSSAETRSAVHSMLRSPAWVWLILAAVVLHCSLVLAHNIPPSVITPPFSWWPGAVEAVLLGLYVTDVCLSGWSLGLRALARKPWQVFFAAVTALSIIDWLAYYAGGAHGMWRFSRPLWPFLGVAKHTTLRRLLLSIFLTIPRMSSVVAVLAIVIAVFGTLGVQLFNSQQVPGYSLSEDHWDSWGAGVLAGYVLSTTENYPSAANRAYRQRPVVATFFFVSALFVMLWLVAPVTLAVVYGHYAKVHLELVRARRVRQYASLVWAYQAALRGDGTAEMGEALFARLLTRLRPDMAAEHAALLFAVLDVDDSRAITVAEFLRLPAVLARVGLGEGGAALDDGGESPSPALYGASALSGPQARPPPTPLFRAPAAPGLSMHALSTDPAADSADAPAAASVDANNAGAGVAQPAAASISSSEVQAAQAVPGAGGRLPVPGGWLRTIASSRVFWMARALCIVLSCAMAAVWGVGPQQAYDACTCDPFVVEQSVDDDSTLTIPPLSAVTCLGAANPACSGGPQLLVWTEWVALVSSVLQVVELAVRAAAHAHVTPPARAPATANTTACTASAAAVDKDNVAATASSFPWPRWLHHSRMSRWCKRFVKYSWLTASGWHALDAAVVAWNLIGSAAILAGARYSLGLGAADWFEASRAARFLRLFSLSASLRAVVSPLGAVTRILAFFVALYCAITFSFAVVGMSIFDGALPDDQWCEHCQPVSFATFPAAWLILVQVTVGNNWNSIMYPNLTAVGTWWAAIYFVLYRFFITDIFVNIVESIVIQAFEAGTQEDLSGRVDAQLATALKHEQQEHHADRVVGPPSPLRLPSPTPSLHLDSLVTESGRVSQPRSTSQRRVSGFFRSSGAPVPSVRSLRTHSGALSGTEPPVGRSYAASLQRRAAKRWQRQLFSDLSGQAGAGDADSDGGFLTSRPGVFRVPGAELRLLEVALRAQEDALTAALAGAFDEDMNSEYDDDVGTGDDTPAPPV